MLRRAVELRLPILQVLSDKKISKRTDILLDLAAREWALAEDLVKALHSFEVATTITSEEYKVSLSCILPIIDGLIKCTYPSGDLPPITSFKATLEKVLKEKFTETDDPTSLACVASFLDPRFKRL